MDVFDLVLVIVRMLRAHAKAENVVKHGARAVNCLATSISSCVELLVAQGVRPVLELIAVDADISAETQTEAREVLGNLV